MLKPSGSLFVNLGDKYAGGNGQSGGVGQLQGGGKNGSREKAATTGGYIPKTDIRAKSLMGLPWRYAIGCIDGQADPYGRGWVLRSEIVWSKPNGLPESVTDRVRRSHEQWFMFTKNGTYYSNVDEIRESRSEVVEGPPQHLPGCPLFVGPSDPLAPTFVERSHERHPGVELFDLSHQERPDERVHGEHVVGAEQPGHAGLRSAVPLAEGGHAELGADPIDLLDDRRRSVVDGDPQVRGAVAAMREADRALSVDDSSKPSQVCTCGHATYHSSLGKLPGSVWTVPTQPLIVPDWLDVDHFAAFPTEWPRRLILGWSPPGICVECGEGRRAVAEKRLVVDHVQNRTRGFTDQAGPSASGSHGAGANKVVGHHETTITGTACACDKPTAPTTPAVVLDPFSGTGTVAGVARALGRYGVGCDLSADYMRLAKWRIWQSGMGAKVESRTDGERQGDLFGASA